MFVWYLDVNKNTTYVCLLAEKSAGGEPYVGVLQTAAGMKQIFLQKQLQAQIIKVTVLNLAGLQSRSEEKTFDSSLAVNEEPGL